MLHAGVLTSWSELDRTDTRDGDAIPALRTKLRIQNTLSTTKTKAQNTAS
jgi:hypothetical protein